MITLNSILSSVSERGTSNLTPQVRVRRSFEGRPTVTSRAVSYVELTALSSFGLVSQHGLYALLQLANGARAFLTNRTTVLNINNI